MAASDEQLGTHSGIKFQSTFLRARFSSAGVQLMLSPFASPLCSTSSSCMTLSAAAFSMLDTLSPSLVFILAPASSVPDKGKSEVQWLV